MKNTYLVLLLLSFISIHSTCKTKSRKSYEKKQQLFKMLDSLHDPYYAKIPDSIKYLVPVLDTMLKDDQRYRDNENTSYYSDNLNEQNRLDSINIVKLIPILNRYGWMDMKDVGIKGEQAITMIMVHSKPGVKKNFYSFLVKALVAKKIRPSDFALFEDKLNVQTGRLQYYGTQVTVGQNQRTLIPAAEPDSIDARRKRMYLMLVGEYVKTSFKSDWNLEKYKKKLPELKKQFKTNDSASFHFEYDAIKAYGH